MGRLTRFADWASGWFRPNGHSGGVDYGAIGNVGTDGAALQPNLASWNQPSPSKRDRDISVTTEKVSAGPRGIRLPMFLPWFDPAQTLSETQEQRLMYRKMLSSGPVKASILGKLFGVAALDLQVISANKKSERDNSIAEFCRWCLAERLKGGVPGLIWEVLIHGLIDGYSVVEKLWVVEDRAPWKWKMVLKGVKAKDVGNDLVPMLDEFRNIKAYMGLRYNAGEFFDPKGFIHYTHLPLYSLPGGMSDFRATYAYYWMLDAAWKIRISGIEKKAFGMLTAEYENVSQIPRLESALSQAKWSNWIAVPRNTRLQVVDMAQRGDDITSKAISDLIEQIFLSIEGATLQALQGQEGTQRGSSAVHKSRTDLWKWFLSVAMQSLLMDRDTGLVPELVDENYLGAAYPTVKLTGIDDSDLKASADLDAVLIQSGLPLSKDEAYERYGRSPPKGDTDAWTQPQGQGQAGQMPGQQGQGGEQGGLPFADTMNPLTPIPLNSLPEGSPIRKMGERLGGKKAAMVYRAAADILDKRRRVA